LFSVIIEKKRLPSLYTAVHLAEENTEKNNYKNKRHRVTLIKPMSHQNKKPI
jgi:hypothetical protein